jgi:AraC family transcriptional activator of tynA and feaB
MPEVFFSFHQTKSSGEELRQWARMVGDLQEATAREFYLANIQVELPPGDGVVKLARAAMGSIRIVQFHSPGISRTNRTQAHIKEDGKHDYLIWFLISGGLHVTQNGRTACAMPHQFVITEAGRPFRIRTTSENSDHHESLQVIVPKSFMAAIFPEINSYTVKEFSVASGPTRIAAQIFSSLFDNADQLPMDTADALAEQALRSVAIALRNERQDQAFDDRDYARNKVRRYIQRHFGEGGLTAAKVALACNISVRLLHSLFSQDVSFHSQLMNLRLAKARELLSSAAAREMQIAEIAYLCGFVSNAHFSRTFSKAMQCPPREYRARSVARE